MSTDSLTGGFGSPSLMGAPLARNGAYGKGPIAFVKLIEAWRAEGGLEGLELTAG